MASVALPLTFTALASSELNAPVTAVQKTVTSLAADEVLVRVSFSSFNPMDLKMQQFNFFQLPLPLVLGFDFSGTVVAVGGSGDSAIQVGAEVFGFSPSGGCFAQFVVVKRQYVLPRGSIPAAEGSTYGVAYCTAAECVMLSDDLSKRRGQWMYIAGAAGGVGHFALQLAKAHGLKVVGSGSKPASLDLMKRLAVDLLVDYSTQDVVKEVLAVTGGRGVDLVYDPTYSTASFSQSASVVASGGRWLRLGNPPPDDTEARKIAAARGAEATYGDLGRYWADPAYQPRIGRITQLMERAEEWYKEGTVQPHISATVDFDAKAVQQAIVDSGNGKLSVGKVVVNIGK